MSDYPAVITPVNLVQPVPRRVRAVLAGQTVLDTTRARYVWEWPHYPQYYIPLADVRQDLLVAEGQAKQSRRGLQHLHALRVGDAERARGPGARGVAGGRAGRHRPLRVGRTRRLVRGGRAGLRPPAQPVRPGGRAALDPHVRVELEGRVLADSASPVLVFETGLPTRYYLNRTDVDFTHLVPSDTVTACRTRAGPAGTGRSGSGARTYADLAWTYDFPTRQLLPIAGLIAFYNEKVDIFARRAVAGPPPYPLFLTRSVRIGTRSCLTRRPALASMEP